MDRVRIAFAWAIVVAFVVSVVADALSPDYTPPLVVQLTAVALAGLLFGPTITRRRGGDDDGP